MAHHEFIPDHYHNTLGWHEPVLEIAPGDSVSTTTVDARGGDRDGQQVAARGNPQTGPFHVTGAEPGDALAVTLDLLRPNRPWGFTAAAVAPNVLDPAFRPRFDDEVEGARWAVDVEAGSVRLAEPEGPPVPPRPAPGPHGGVFRRGPRAGSGHLHVHLRAPRRQHGLPRLPAGRNRLVPRLRPGSPVPPRRRPRRARGRRDRRHGRGDLLRRALHRGPRQGLLHPLAAGRGRHLADDGGQRQAPGSVRAARHHRDAALAGERPRPRRPHRPPAPRPGGGLRRGQHLRPPRTPWSAR